MANTSTPSNSHDFKRGVREGHQCTPVKDSIDLAECINSVRDRGKTNAKEPVAYDAGISLTQWRLQDAIFQALQSLPVTTPISSASKVSHDMTMASFVAAQRALRKAGFSDGEGLGAAGFRDGVSVERWSYWSTQPLPSWITPEK